MLKHLILSLLLLLNASTVVAQNSLPDHVQKEASLVGILRSIERTEQELHNKQEEFRSPRGEGRREDLTQQVQQIVAKLNDLRHNFDEISAGVDSRIFQDRKEEDTIQWAKEAKDLFTPIINEIRRLTSRPREIDKLQTQIAEARDNLVLIATAKDNVERLISHTTDAQLITELNRALTNWQSREETTAAQLDISQQKLDQKLAERKPLSQSLENIFQIFFRSRGRNLLAAALATILMWVLLRRLQRWIEKVSPLHRKGKSFSVRVFNVLYSLLTFCGAIFAFLAVLYYFGDWVLLIIGIMFLLGIVWASKQAIPIFWQQGTLLLNMGAVRENERVQYEGVQYVVKNINFYTQLHNPLIIGGRERLPIRDLVGLRSRPHEPNEPLFPTTVGDWVLLGDIYGQVQLQSAEQVMVKMAGGAMKTFCTQDFLKSNPTNLSAGFRHTITFGIDYRHQAEATSGIPEKLRAFALEVLEKEGFASKLSLLQVEFKSAAASSLDIQVIADFRGSAAGDYLRLDRLLGRICVDAANTYGWTIPFSQLTVHMAPTTA